MEFGKRLRKQARRCGNVYSEKQLISKFVRGLREDVKPLVRAMDLEGLSRSFNTYVEKAYALGESHRALSSRTSARRVRLADVKHPKKALSIESGSRSNTSVRPILAAGEQLTFSSRPDTATVDTDYDRLMEEQPSSSEEGSVLSAERRSKRYPFPNRPNWKVDRVQNSPDDICFECYGVGHKKPNCPNLERSSDDPAYRTLQKNNYGKLHRLQKEWLSTAGQTPMFAKEGRGRDPMPPPPKIADLPVDDPIKENPVADNVQQGN